MGPRPALQMVGAVRMEDTDILNDLRAGRAPSTAPESDSGTASLLDTSSSDLAGSDLPGSETSALGAHVSLANAARGRVSRLEYLQMRIIRRTLEPGFVDRALRWFQRTFGVWWITLVTFRLHRIHHMDRLLPLAPLESFILVSNHRSFFDLYVLIAAMLRWGLRQRIVFPVRSNFFYDTVAGFFVNGVMSFFAMYPPLFRDKRRATLNIVGIEELGALLRQGETLVGIHPEGRRNTSDDPYELLPAKSGVGRLIHAAGSVAVVPVFTNGLLPNNLPRQIISNFDGTGTPIHSVFGHAIDFGDLLSEPPSLKLFTKIAEICMDEVRKLGEQERVLRALEGQAAPKGLTQ